MFFFFQAKTLMVLNCFSQSGSLSLDTTLSGIVCTSRPECVIVFVITFCKLNGRCFLRCAGLVEWHRWIPRTFSSRNFDPPDLKTCQVKVYVFIFLWENHDVVRLGLQSRVTHIPDLPREVPVHRGRQCQIWTRIETSEKRAG